MAEPIEHGDMTDATRPATPPNVPPGDHPLEIAARRGIGPLSALAQKVWHGEALPCVSCGRLVRRSAAVCDSCGQDLSEEMLAKMRTHAGPWYVLEHLRPFPGVSLERIVLQIRRGVLTATSIVRGPATDYQWRFAVETPGLCRLFGRCWNCYHGVASTDTFCPACLSNLTVETPNPPTDAPDTPAVEPQRTPQPRRAEQPALQPSARRPSARSPSTTRTPGNAETELELLASVVRQGRQPQSGTTWESPSRVGPFHVAWIAAALVVLVIAALLWITSLRGGAEQASGNDPAARAASD